MDKVLTEKELSSETDLKVEIIAGDVHLSVEHASKGVGASLGVKISTDYFLDKLAAAIPGEIDDAVIAMIKAAAKQ